MPLEIRCQAFSNSFLLSRRGAVTRDSARLPSCGSRLAPSSVCYRAGALAERAESPGSDLLARFTRAVGPVYFQVHTNALFSVPRPGGDRHTSTRCSGLRAPLVRVFPP